MSQINDYDSGDDDIPELDSVSSSEYVTEEKTELESDDDGEGHKEGQNRVVEIAKGDEPEVVRETLKLLDLDEKGDIAPTSWVNSFDFQQYNGVAVVTIPTMHRAPEHVNRWLRFDDDRASAIKAYLLSPFLYGHAHQSDKWLDWCSYGKLLKSSSTNYNTQTLTDVELSVVEAMEIAANECLTMLENDSNMKSRMDDIFNQTEKAQNFYQMIRLVEDTDWLRSFVKKISPHTDDKDREQLQPNGLNTVAVCTILHVYEYMFGRSDQPDFMEEFQEQCDNDEKDSEPMKLKGNELFLAKKFTEAITIYSEAIILYPFNVYLYSNRAACYLRTKDYSAALSDGYRAIVLRRGWYKGYCRYLEAFAHINYKKAATLHGELTSKFTDATALDQLRAALAKPKTTAAAASAKAASVAKKISSAESLVSDPPKEAEVKISEPKSAVKKSGDATEQYSKGGDVTEANENATKDTTNDKATCADSDVKKTTKTTVTKTKILHPETGSSYDIETVETTIQGGSMYSSQSVTAAAAAMLTNTYVTPEQAVANVAPAHLTNSSKKEKYMATSNASVSKQTTTPTAVKPGSSGSRDKEKSVAGAKEKSKEKEKEKSRSESESKLSKSDHKLRKNVMFNLHHASKSLIDKNYRNAIKLFETALREIETSKAQWHHIMSSVEHNRLMVTIHYCLGVAVWQHRREDYIVIAMTHFRTITTRYSSVIFIPAYYYLGLANAALHSYKEALKDVLNGLNHVIRSRSAGAFTYPGFDEVIEESNPHIIESKLRQLKHRYSPKLIVEATCRYGNCLIHHISTDIIRDDPEFKGYVAITCTERCVITYHSSCWRKLREDNVNLPQSDKELLGIACITNGCHGVTKAIKHYEGMGRPKIITQSEPTSEPSVKKESRPPKINRTKPSSSKKLERIIQRHQERVADWRLRKEREAMATQLSHESSIATPSVDSTVDEMHSYPATPDIAEADASVSGDIRKGGLEVHVSKQPAQDDTESKLKIKTKKRKAKQRDKERLLTGFTLFEHTGISGSDEIDESGNVQKTDPPKTVWNSDAPFSVPEHLREKHNAFEGLQAGKGVPTYSSVSAPAGVVAMSSAEADNLISYFVEIMDKHGPMEINDERLFGQLAILPENSQMLIEHFGGLEKFLLSTTAFVKQEGLLCLAEYAAVVAASMNNNNCNDDKPTSSLHSNNSLKHTGISRDGIVKELELSGGAPSSLYGLKQKGLNKMGKDLTRGGKLSNGVSPNKSLYTNSAKNEKKNSSITQPTKQQTGLHASASLSGAYNSSPGKSSLPNKSTDPHSINSNNSSYSNGSHPTESVGRRTSTSKQYNLKETLSSSSISSGLDPIETSFGLSRKSSAGLLNSASNEHSQEMSNCEDDALIGNLFDYNMCGTGSSSNHLSPSVEGFFPNAYPQDQMDSSSLLSDISIEPDLSAKMGYGPAKKSGSLMLESAITASSMDSAKNMKLLTSGVDVNADASLNYRSGSDSVSYSGGGGGRHMEPVYLPPPPPIKQPALVTVVKRQTCIQTDFVYVYSENYKEKYENAVKARSEVLKRLEESEDRRVQMSNTHAMELDLAVKRAREDTKMEYQQVVESCREQMRDENRKMAAERKEHQETIKSLRNEIKSLNDRTDKLKKELQAKTSEINNNFIRYQGDLEGAHKEKKKAEDRLKIANDIQKQSLQRAMEAEIQMLAIMREYTGKEVDRRIIECDNICTRLPTGSDIQKEWLAYKENTKAALEQYKASVDGHIEQVKQGKPLSSLGPLRITPPQPPQPPQLPFTMGPPSGMQAQAPPSQATPMYHHMMPSHIPQQMAQGQNIRPQMQPSPAVATTVPHGYQGRPSYPHMMPQGVATTATPPQHWGNVTELQSMMQQEVVDMKIYQPQQLVQQDGQNGPNGGATSQQNNTDTKAQSSFERIVERLTLEYPNYTKEDFKAVLKQVRAQQGPLSNRTMDYIMQQMREVIVAKEMSQTSAQPTSQQQTMTPATTAVAISDSPTITHSSTTKSTPSKKQLDKVTVRTLPKKQGQRGHLVPPYISPPKKPNLNPAFFPIYNEDENECIICQEDMRDNNFLKLQCGHRFHKSCIQSWFKEQSTCPTCRRHVLLPEEYPVLGQ